MGDTPSTRARRIASRYISCLPDTLSGAEALGIIATTDADENSGCTAIEVRRRNRGVFERLPSDLQEQSLLRIKCYRLAWRQIEKSGVECFDISKKAPITHGTFGVFSKISAVIPAIGWGGANSINALCEQCPESLRRIGIARKATGHADNGNRII